MDVTMLRAMITLAALTVASGAVAQVTDESALEALDKAEPVAVPVISEPAGAAELRSAIRRISLNPSDADALADAGNASLTLGDANAALNFYTRANALRPKTGRIVAGLATATVRTENPFEALRLFDDAIRLGISERSIAADRALAFDLLGNFGRAQQDYQLARTVSNSDDLIVKQAISASLGGQAAEADTLLIPLLQKKSSAAWRARAFILAARGEFRESTKVTQGFMDATSAQRIERYLRLMPSLTGAQQAAAIHLGHFPASQFIGRDSEQVRKVASNIPQTQIASTDSRLIPSGAPLGSKSAKPASQERTKATERRRDRKEREQQEVKAIVANIPESMKLPKTDSSRLGTESARAKVEEASTAKIVSATTTALPTPESARPLQTVELPARNASSGLLTVPSSVNVAAQSSAPIPASTTLQNPTPGSSNSGASLSEGPGIISSGMKTDSVAGVIPQKSEQLISANPMAAANNTPAAIFPAANSPVSAAAVPASALSSSPLSPPTGSSSPATLVPPPIAQSPVVASASQPSSVVASSPAPAAAGFDLAAIVSSIEIPESEQKPSAVPVDLKKIKPVPPKIAISEDPAKNAKVDPKIAAKAKLQAANPARYWVQIATGEASALGFDYRKWTKKNPVMFKSLSGWTSPWGRTSRLLVGPFADMKLAKKWEADFKKSGGDAFMWKSENGVVVTALKDK